MPELTDQEAQELVDKLCRYLQQESLQTHDDFWDRREAEEIARRVEYLELTIEKGFQDEFMNSMAFPHMRDLFPHLKGIVEDDILNQ